MDNIIKWATGIAVFLVACFAAIKSYEHIFYLGHHDPILPLCIDGMIVTSSLVLLAASRARLGTILLARFGLWLGIAATLAANVAYGWPDGFVSAVTSAWPAVCFVVTVETVMQLAKAKRVRRVPSVAPVRSAAQLATKEPKSKTPRPVVAPTPVTQSGKALSIRDIRDATGCGQPIAYDIRTIMAEQGVNVHEAYSIRKGGKKNAS